jgi:hypothetical protein
MCDKLKSDPLIEDIPPDIEDFPSLVQKAFQVYGMLSDDIDYFNGKYRGKQLLNLEFILTLVGIDEIEDKKLVFECIRTMDSSRAKILNKEKSP